VRVAGASVAKAAVNATSNTAAPSGVSSAATEAPVGSSASRVPRMARLWRYLTAVAADHAPAGSCAMRNASTACATGRRRWQVGHKSRSLAIGHERFCRWVVTGCRFMGELLGYARVSTTGQDPRLQHDALSAAGCWRTWTDVASGAKTDRPQLADALVSLRPGDTLVVWRLDRLGRSLPHLIETVQGLADRGVGFRSLQEAIDTSTLQAVNQ